MKFKKYGLIGYPLSHSFSQKYFTRKFKGENITSTYTNFPIKSIEELPVLLKNNPGLAGLNVTTPYKEAVIPYLHELSSEAINISAVNTIVVGEKLIGHNTDILGFQKSLEKLLQAHHKNALVLGDGGAAKAVKKALKQLGILYTTVTRKKEKLTITYDEVTEEIIESHLVIINCTPLGTFPNIEEFPNIPYEYITPLHLLYDLVYNPTQTAFLEQGKRHGANVRNGLEMLHLQAEASWKIWQHNN